MRIGTLLVALAVVSFGSSRIEGQVRQDSPLERARNGDDTALSEMERKGDVQDLQILLHDPSYAGKFAARLALARMGDVEVLQYYACRSLTVDVSQVEDLMRQDLDYIGGGFTIEIYRRLLDSDPKFIPQIEGAMGETRKHGGDSWPQLPSSLALLSFINSFPIPQVQTCRHCSFKPTHRQPRRQKQDGDHGLIPTKVNSRSSSPRREV
jgi:hypothetical protein